MFLRFSRMLSWTKTNNNILFSYFTSTKSFFIGAEDKDELKYSIYAQKTIKHRWLVNEIMYVYMYIYNSYMCIYVYWDYELINEAAEFKCNDTTTDLVINDTISTMQKHWCISPPSL